MTNRKCKIGKKTYAARRIAAVLMSATLAGTIAAAAPGMVQVSAATYSENADYIFEVLTGKLGYSEAAACGIMANIRCESTFNPHAWNAGGGSYGLCQWTGGRYGRLQSWCRSNGYDYTTIDGQLAYLEYELQNHYRGVEDYLRSVDNTSAGAYDAGQYYCYHFEAPASRGSVSVYRGGLASGTFWDAYRPAEWYFEDGVWRYIKRDGTYHKSWLTVDNKTYYLDENGNRISGWRTIDGNRYYFDKDGVMASGWVKIDGKDYYFGEDGPLITGLVRNSDSWYMLDEAGNIQASEEMARYASSWNEKNQAETLASADEQSADDRSAESVESVESIAAADKADASAEANANDQPSPVASSLAAPGDNTEPNQNIVGIGLVKNPETTVLPSIPPVSSTDEVNVNDETDEEVTAPSENAAEETASAESTEEEAASAESTEEETASAVSTEEEAASAVSTEEETASAESTEEETASAESTEEETAATAQTAAEAADEAPDAEKADNSKTSAEASEQPGTGLTAKEAEEVQKAPEEAATAAEEKETQEAPEEAATDDTAKAADDFAAADALRAAAEAANEESEEPSNGFFMIYDPDSSEDQSNDSATQKIAKILPPEDETAEAAGAADTSEAAASTETAETAATVEAEVTAASVETAGAANTSEAVISAETGETAKTAETAAAEDKTDKADSAKTTDISGTAASTASGNVEISLSDEILFIPLDKMEELVKYLDENDLLKAVTKDDGKVITDKVKAEYEQIDPRGNAYNVVFTVDYKGKTSTLESIFYAQEVVR